MELIRTLESGDEIYVTGRFKGTHKNDLETPLGTIVARATPWTCSTADTQELRLCDPV